MKDILSWSCVIGFFFKLAYKIIVRINLSTHALYFFNCVQSNFECYVPALILLKEPLTRGKTEKYSGEIEFNMQINMENEVREINRFLPSLFKVNSFIM